VVIAYTYILWAVGSFVVTRLRRRPSTP
jgi:hypothetical protein